MTVTIDLKPEIETRLIAQAKARGLSVEDYLQQELERQISRAETTASTPEERVRDWQEFLKQHSIGGPPLPDYAISRESIYSREDEMI